jgi:DNA integrity scanning protein DisA with diadenylate cyclase activity
MSNNERLMSLMDDHGLDSSQVATMIGVSPWTVRNWKRSQSARGYRTMPDMAIKALEMNIALRPLMELEKPISEDDHLDLVFLPAVTTR